MPMKLLKAVFTQSSIRPYSLTADDFAAMPDLRDATARERYVVRWITGQHRHWYCYDFQLRAEETELRFSVYKGAPIDRGRLLLSKDHQGQLFLYIPQGNKTLVTFLNKLPGIKIGFKKGVPHFNGKPVTFDTPNLVIV